MYRSKSFAVGPSSYKMYRFKGVIKEFSKDLLKYLPSKAVPGVFSIVTIPVLTRLFSSREYGEYFLVVSTISFVGILAAEWIGPSVIRFYTEYEVNSALTLFNGTIIRMVGISTIIVGCGAFLMLQFFRHEFSVTLYYYFRIGILIFILSVFSAVMMEMLVAKRNPSLYSFFHIWRRCICLLIGIALVLLWRKGVDVFLWGNLIGIIMIIPILFKLTVGKDISLRYSSELRSKIMQYGFPLAVTNIAAWALSLSDRYIIQYFRGSHEVGLYSISYQLGDHSIQLLISLIVLSSAPIIVQIWEKKGVEETANFLRSLTRIYIVLAIPAMIGLSLLSKSIVELLTTKEFFEGYKIIPMVAAGLFIFGLQRNYQVGLLLHRKTGIIMYGTLLSAAFNIIFNLIFVPRFGYVAAGFSTLLGYILFAVLIIFMSRKYLVWSFPFETLYRVMIAGVGMSFIVVGIISRVEIVWLEIVISVFAGSTVYLLVLYLLGEFDINAGHDLASRFLGGGVNEKENPFQKSVGANDKVGDSVVQGKSAHFSEKEWPRLG